jgi:hypothetical protein
LIVYHHERLTKKLIYGLETDPHHDHHIPLDRSSNNGKIGMCVVI